LIAHSPGLHNPFYCRVRLSSSSSSSESPCLTPDTKIGREKNRKSGKYMSINIAAQTGIFFLSLSLYPFLSLSLSLSPSIYLSYFIVPDLDRSLPLTARSLSLYSSSFSEGRVCRVRQVRRRVHRVRHPTLKNGEKIPNIKQIYNFIGHKYRLPTLAFSGILSHSLPLTLNLLSPALFLYLFL
jgi:hypothetical protein